MDRPALGVSIQPDPACARAISPFLRAGRLEAVELTVDAALQSGLDALPSWFGQVVRGFSAAGRLYAHGVGLSGMSGAATTPRQHRWMDDVAAFLHSVPCRSLSVHCGWATAGPVTFGAPLSPPPSSRRAHTTLTQRLAVLHERTGLPIGVENLGFGWSARDALARPAHWHALVRAPSQPYLHLDLHNLWCQAATWSLHLDDLLDAFPLWAVRVVHVAGGRWSVPIEGEPPVRRDTHDDTVPEAVWTALPHVLARCPHVEAVFYERIGGAWQDSAAIGAELERLAVVLTNLPAKATLGPAEWDDVALVDDTAEELDAWQQAVLDAPSPGALLRVVTETAPYANDFRDVDVRMVHVAHELVQRWARRA